MKMITMRVLFVGTRGYRLFQWYVGPLSHVALDWCGSSVVIRRASGLADVNSLCAVQQTLDKWSVVTISRR